jgi:hypothetical protein
MSICDIEQQTTARNLCPSGFLDVTCNKSNDSTEVYDGDAKSENGSPHLQPHRNQP